MTGQELIDWAVKMCVFEDQPPTDSNVIAWMRIWDGGDDDHHKRR